jgi:S1-C subfamily serine protease
VILRVEDNRIATPADISGRLRTLGGKAVPVGLMRDHKEMSVTVMIESPSPRNSGRPFNVQQQ